MKSKFRAKIPFFCKKFESTLKMGGFYACTVMRGVMIARLYVPGAT